MSRVIAVLNQKGGVGKTTTTLNVAAYLAMAGKTVLVVDMDPQGNASSGLGVDKQLLNSTMYDVLFNTVETSNIVIKSNLENLYILPSNSQLAAAEVDLVGEAKREFRLKNVLVNLSYDYVFIDCPPSLGLLSINALAASDYVLIPVQAEYYALEGLGQLLDIIQRVRAGINPKLELLGVVITMYDKRTTLAEQVVAEVEKHFGNKLFKTFIPRNVRLAESPSFGKTIVEHDKWSKGARAYKNLTKEISGRLG